MAQVPPVDGVDVLEDPPLELLLEPELLLELELPLELLLELLPVPDAVELEFEDVLVVELVFDVVVEPEFVPDVPLELVLELVLELLLELELELVLELVALEPAACAMFTEGMYPIGKSELEIMIPKNITLTNPFATAFVG